MVMMSDMDSPIAVLDSGVGGLSVLRELLCVLPHESYVFYGDEANAPYGTKRHEEVRRITFANVERLRNEYGCKAVVIACNTATGAAAAALRSALPELPIIGIEPELKSAALMGEHPRVLVMATPLTLRQDKFLELRNRFSDRADFTLLPCPGLMELIESGHIHDALLKRYLDSLFSALDADSFDAVVLGCTHFPLLVGPIRHALGPGVRVVSSAEETTRELTDILTRREQLAGDAAEPQHRFATTADNIAEFAVAGSFIFGQPLKSIEHIDIDELK